MSKMFIVTSKPTCRAEVRYGQSPVVDPNYLLLLGLIVLVGAAFAFSWWSTEFSLETRARQGEAQAQYLLGKRCFGEAVSRRDYTRAALMIGKAAEQGYARAQTALGLLYENGLGVGQDDSKAATWLRRAADQGFPVAQNELGVMYAKGRGFARDLDQAVRWCQLAAAQGSEVARRNLQVAQVAQRSVIPEITTLSKETYKHVRLEKIEPGAVTVSFRTAQGGLGVTRLKFQNLPQEFQELCKCTDKNGIGLDSAYSQLGCISITL